MQKNINPPSTFTKRKKVFNKAEDVIYIFLTEDGRPARSRNCFIDGNTLYSYGYHYPLIKRTFSNKYGIVYFLNMKKDSQTTNNQRVDAQHFLYKYKYIEIPDLKKELPLDIIKDMIDDILTREEKLSRIKKHKHFKETEIKWKEENLLNYMDYFDISALELPIDLLKFINHLKIKHVNNRENE